MARNRKRAKDRRTHRPQPVASVAPDHEQRRSPTVAGERDEGENEQADLRLEETDLELEVPAALVHAAPDVELAEAQLAVGRPDLEGAVDADLDEDELEREAADAGGAPASGASGSRRGGALAPAAATAPARRVGTVTRVITFLQGSWRELQRVQWPDRRQVMQATGVVIGFVIVAGVFLGVADTLSSHITNLILTGKW